MDLRNLTIEDVAAASGITPLTHPPLYAPMSAAKISEAADLIEKAARLLDNAGDRFVIAAIEAIPATEHINTDTAAALRALAERLDA